MNRMGEQPVTIDVALLNKVVAEPFDAVIAEGEKIAADPRWSAEHKTEQLSEHLATAKARLEQTVGAGIAAQEKELAELRAKSQPSRVPSTEEIAQLSYVRDALSSTWNNMLLGDILKAWRTALDAKDLITARVYRDFAGPVLQQKSGGLKEPPGFQELAVATDEALFPGSKAARERAARLEITIPQMKGALARRLEELPRTRFGANAPRNRSTIKF